MQHVGLIDVGDSATVHFAARGATYLVNRVAENFDDHAWRHAYSLDLRDRLRVARKEYG